MLPKQIALTLPAALSIAAIAGLDHSPALGQQQVETSFELGGIRLTVTPKEMAVLVELRQALRRPPLAQNVALAAAQRVARGADARYVAALYQLEIGRHRRDSAMRAEALDALIASDLTPRSKRADYLGERGRMAYELGDLGTAKRLWTRMLDDRPGDADLLASLALIEQAENNPEAAAALLARASASRRATGDNASEDLHRQRLSIASQGKLVPVAIDAAHKLVSAYPTARNWRDALVVYRQLVAPTDALEIELLRLMRATGTLSRADEHQRFAQLLRAAGVPAEAKAVLSDGLSRGLLDPAQSPTREIIAEVDRAVTKQQAISERRDALTAAQLLDAADRLAGAGRHAEALALYRKALAASQAAPPGANVRFGRALALAGQRSQAETAFRVAIGSPQAGAYGDLARFWLAWLAAPPASPSPTRVEAQPAPVAGS